MKSPFLSLLAFICCAALNSQAAQAAKILPTPANESAVALQAESDLIKAARQAAGQDDDATIEAKLALAPHPKLKLASSVALARRAAAVCGWLRNDNEYARAVKLAHRTIAQLAGARETNQADRVERLYWEAMLEGDILDRKERALRLLEEAAQLAPGDKRIAQEKQRWSAALAAFGK